MSLKSIPDEIKTQLVDILLELKINVGEIKSASLVYDTGLPIVSTLQDGKETSIAAMTAAQLALAENSVHEVGLGNYKRLLVEGKNGNLLIMRANDITVLTVATTEHIKLGLLFLDSNRACEKVANLIQE